jgi:hypothetical protein
MVGSGSKHRLSEFRLVQLGGEAFVLDIPLYRTTGRAIAVAARKSGSPTQTAERAESLRGLFCSHGRNQDELIDVWEWAFTRKAHGQRSCSQSKYPAGEPLLGWWVKTTRRKAAEILADRLPIESIESESKRPSPVRSVASISLVVPIAGMCRTRSRIVRTAKAFSDGLREGSRHRTLNLRDGERTSDGNQLAWYIGIRYDKRKL